MSEEHQVPDGLRLRCAEESDIRKIQELLAQYAEERLLLPRTGDDIRRHLANFIIAELDNNFAGCAALRDYGNRLFELRSLAVCREFSKRGIGSRLVAFQLERLQAGGGGRVFALTYHPKLFARLGFHHVDKEMFPEKIWSDCALCPKRESCDEEALLIELKGGVVGEK